MQARSIDAWLVHDFRGNNPVMTQILGEHQATRRSLLCLPGTGEPVLIVHRIDKEAFGRQQFKKCFYTTWQELRGAIADVLRPYARVAMEYSPGATIPTMATVDAGTIEVVRALGIEVVSSADLFQLAAASCNKEALKSHLSAAQHVSGVKDLAFAYIASSLRAGSRITEYDVQQFIHAEFANRDLETEDNVVVAVNENSGNPHYAPSSSEHSIIRTGDWILIDLWGRHPGQQNVFGDITWVAYAGSHPSEKQQRVFDVVREARDAVLSRLRDAWEAGDQLQGWQLDRTAREHIESAGFGEYFTHRTGHSIGPGRFLHALGVNLDSFETYDTRRVLPGIGFSVEPGIYLPEFGVRLEINVFVDPLEGITVATPAQNEIVCVA